MLFRSRGQNVSLAARLTGCRIDIKCESKDSEGDLEEFASYDGTLVEETPESEQIEPSAPELNENSGD